MILHLGDHDPSGLDMTRDIRDRLAMFTGATPEEVDGEQIFRLPRMRYFQIKRIALTREQIEEYRPPPNPAKTTDARFKAYQDEHGDESWELDALDPETITELVREHTEAAIDPLEWEGMKFRETNDRMTLKKLVDGLKRASSNLEK